MNVYIVMDMEGISGITDGRMIRTGHVEWADRGRYLATADVNAAILGALEGGAERIYVKDGHDSGQNIVIEELNKAAELISGTTASTKLMPGIGDGFDVVLLIGFHARMGTNNAHFDHTVSTACVSEVRLNGTAVGEIGIYAAYAGHLGIPIGLVTGDEAAIRETTELLGNIQTVAVKQGYGRISARLHSPSIVQPRIRTAAQKAVCAGGRPWKVGVPLQVAVQFLRSAEADMAEVVPGAQRTGPRTLEYCHDDPQMSFQALQAMINLGGIAASRWARALYTTGSPTT